MLKNLFTIPNKVKVTLEKENWETKTYEFSNMTCTKWRSSIARRLVDSTTPELWSIKYIAIWDVDTPAQESDTNLGNEIRREPIKMPDTVLNNNLIKVYARFPIWFSALVKEAGLFIDADATIINGSGSLLAHSVFPTPVNKIDAEVMTIERTVSIVNVVV